MSPPTTLWLRYAARSDVGLLREGNEDSGYAGPHLIAVADGMGGAAAGEVASSVVVATFARLDEDEPAGDVLATLSRSVEEAQDQLRVLVDAEPRLSGMGTTLTALLRSGSRLGLVHVGDSRAYLLRDDRFEQITHDHTLVQSLVDAGRLRPEDAAGHPQRSVLTRVLDGTTLIEPDLSVREIRAGDRLLVCSDGLCGVVPDALMARTLHDAADPAAAVESLVALALKAGGPDNITCVVADVVEGEGSSAQPAAVGAVGSPGGRRRLPPEGAVSSAAPPRVKGDTAAGGASAAGPRRRRWLVIGALGALLVGMALGAVISWYAWSQSQYYVGDGGNGTVSVYRGPSQRLFGIRLSSVVETTDVTIADLPEFEAQAVAETIPASSRSDATRIVTRLRREAAECATASPPAGCPGG